MTYGKNEKGEGVITLTPEEDRLFRRGRQIDKVSGDSRGIFTISLKLSRPRTNFTVVMDSERKAA